MVCCSSAIENWSGSGGACSGPGKAMEGRWWWRGRLGSARPCCWRSPGTRQRERVSGYCGARGAELEREFAFGVVRQLVEPVVAGASEEERSQLLDGPPGVAARLLGLPGLGDGVATAAPIAPDPSFAVLARAVLVVRQPGRCNTPWRWWWMTPIGLTVRRFAFWLFCCPAWRSCMPRCCSGLGRPRPERVGSCWPP